jgi:uncharacterized protein (TIGR00725 family)
VNIVEIGEDPGRPLISVIGQGDVPVDDPRYDLAVKLGKALIDKGYRLVTGGYGGIMEGASMGARQSDKYTEGDVIGILKGFDRKASNRYVDIPITTGFGIARNQIVAGSDAVIAIGGGSGTLSEIAMAWQLGRLIIAYRVEGWSGKLADRTVDGRIRYPDIDDDMVYGVDGETDAVLMLDRYLTLYMDHY